MVAVIDDRLNGFSKYVGPMALSVEELLGILNDESIFKTDDLTASNEKYRFKSIQDMRENSELLKGKPKLQGTLQNGSYFYIDFANDVRVHSYGLKSEKDLASLERIYRKLCEFRTPFFLLKYYPKSFVIPALIMLAWYVVVMAYIYFIITDELPKASSNVGASLIDALVLYASMVAIPISLIKVSVGLFPIVRVTKSPPLWTKIKENIVTYLLVFILGGAMTSILNWLGRSS